MLLLTVDKSSGTPVYKQISSRIAGLIEDGAMKPGDRLPSTRNLANAIGTHRSTVIRAYEECRALGYLESTSGSYTKVRNRGRVPITGRRPSSSVINWDEAIVNRFQGAETHGPPVLEDGTPARTSLINFETLAADPSLMPVDVLRRCIKQALEVDEATALSYTDPAGWPPLRASIAERLCLHGMVVSPDEVLISNGTQQALDLVLRLLTQPGDCVAVEAPTYGMFHRLVSLHGVRQVQIRMTAHGMDLDELERKIAIARPKLLYTMPTFHNPMGITTDPARREKLIDICEAARVPIVEDGFEEEMKYFGNAVLPLKSIDRGGVVFYVGSFSKVVYSGLRVGWIAAPLGAIAHLANIQQASCLSVNTLCQAALARFCADGHFDSHLRRIHGICRRRMQRMLRGLHEHMPPGVSWTKPAGGYTLWLTLPATAGEEKTLNDEFREAGVALAPGRRFFLDKQSTLHFRVSIACVDHEDIDEGCRRLGGVLSGKNLTG